MESMRHAIFDLDGTLIDSLPGIAWSVERALAECGLPPLTVDLKPLIGPPIRSILATVTGLADAPALDRLERAFRMSYDTEGWRKTTCYEGVAAMLRRLAAGGIGLWVVSNKPRHAALRILRELELDGFFREIVCPDSHAPRYVSKAECLIGLLNRHSLSSRECLLIGDTREDAEAAAAAGIGCAIVEHGYGGPDIQAARVSFRNLFEEVAPSEYAARD